MHAYEALSPRLSPRLTVLLMDPYLDKQQVRDIGASSSKPLFILKGPIAPTHKGKRSNTHL